LQQLPGFGRSILTSFWHSASVTPYNGLPSLPLAPAVLTLLVITGKHSTTSLASCQEGVGVSAHFVSGPQRKWLCPGLSQRGDGELSPQKSVSSIPLTIERAYASLHGFSPLFPFDHRSVISYRLVSPYFRHKLAVALHTFFAQKPFSDRPRHSTTDFSGMRAIPKPTVGGVSVSRALTEAVGMEETLYQPQ
jgi:hypothetical protein